jgi:hypothetical protein
VRVAFDSRPGAGAQGAGHYSRCLLQALRDIAGERHEILETHRPRRAEVFHTPWIEGAMLHSPCPMVVTIHDLRALTRRSERLRGGGVHLRLRHLALQRATHVIVPTEVLAGEAVAELGLERERVVVIPQAPDPLVAATPQAPEPPVAATPRVPDPLVMLAPQAPDPLAEATCRPASTAPTWTWEDAGRETWRVYEEAVARPERACVSGFSRRRAAKARQGPSSAGS